MTSRDTGRPPFGWSDVFMLSAVVMWGMNFSLVKIGLRELSPRGFNGLRIVLSGGLLLAILGFSERKFKGIRARDLGKLALIGIMGNAVYQVLFIGSMTRTTASNASFILALAPIFIALLSAALGMERMRGTVWLGLLISFSGLYLILARTNGGFDLASAGLRGDLMIFGGTILWAFYTVLGKPFLVRITPLQYAAVTVGIGAAVYLPMTIGAIVAIPWRRISVLAWGCLVLSALFGLVLGYLIWYNSVRRIGNTRTAIYNNLTPPFTALFAWIILGEKMRGVQVAGAAIILVGVYLTRWGAARTRVREECPPDPSRPDLPDPTCRG